MYSQFKKIKKMYDLRFKNPSTFTLAGPSQCGKTTFIMNVLRNQDLLFEDPRCKQNVIYFYNQWQKSFDVLSKENVVTEWANKLPTSDDVMEKTSKFADQGGSVIVIDDFAQQLKKDTIDIFSRLSHHTNSTVFLLTQNIFSKNPVFRDISLNSTYIALFKNPRDSSQIRTFARQFAPGDTDYIVDSYSQTTKKPYSYMFYDHHQSTPQILRVRSNVLPHEAPMRIYTSKKKGV